MDNMNNLEQNKLFELYTLAELAYQKQFEKIVEDKSILYPEGWYEKKDYKLKIEIIKEAIKSNTLIENTPKYLETLEGINHMFVKE